MALHAWYNLDVCKVNKEWSSDLCKDYHLWFTSNSDSESESELYSQIKDRPDIRKFLVYTANVDQRVRGNQVIVTIAHKESSLNKVLARKK